MRLCLSIALLLSLCWPQNACGSDEEADHSIVHGTINVAFGNRNGMVVLTDSMLTSGNRQLSEPGQKLFKLDEQTVCAIAGFIAAPASSGSTAIPTLNANLRAVIQEYVHQSASQRPQTITERLQALAMLIRFRLTTIANVREVLVGAGGDYRFQLIIAGYDTDGNPKIGKIFLNANNHPWGLTSDVEDFNVFTIKDELIPQLNGMRDVADTILGHPDLYPDDSDIKLYAEAKRENGGSSMTVEQMLALAKRIAYYTAKAHREVGGSNQIAILRRSANVEVTQQTFPNAELGLARFHLSVTSTMQYSDWLPIDESVPNVLVRCDWISSKFHIDNLFFVGCNFKDSVLYYNGGPFSLENINHVDNTALVVGPNVNRDDESLRRLIRDFSWSQVIYRTAKAAPSPN
jgi:20S proteasome alpha/beta subunit